MRSLMRVVLRELGMVQIRDALDPAQAFKYFQETDYDLIMTDWAPTLDGMSFLKNIRTHPESRNPFAPVIVVTAHTELGRVYMARDAGMTEFLAKPISAKLLYTRIRSVIESKRAFVKSQSFFGPDRRRRRLEFDGLDKRRGDEAEAQMPPGEAGGDTRDENRAA